MQRSLEPSSLPDLGDVRLPGEGPLRILQLTDLHLFPATLETWRTGGRDVDCRCANDACLALVAQLVQRVKPQLCILTGDTIDGRPFRGAPRTAWRAVFEALTAPLVEAGCSWTFCPGNHDDDDSPWPRDSLLGLYELPGCISAGARAWDHTLTLRCGETAVRAVLLDSGGNDAEFRYGTVSAAAVAGCAALRAVAAREQRKALCFFHIPPPEAGGLCPVVGTQGLFDAALRSGKVPAPFCWVPWLVRLLGRDLVVGCSTRNAGLHRALVESGAFSACFFGHDHHSDAIFRRDGLYLAYGRVGATTPPATWEGKAPLPFAPGARVIEVDAACNVSTWVETAAGEERGSRLHLDPRLEPGLPAQGARSRPWSRWAALLLLVPLVLAGLDRGSNRALWRERAV